MQAHRLAWITAFGPIEAETKICHTCDIRHCIEVDHLFKGSDLDNSMDKIRKGRAGWQVHPGFAARGDRHGTHTKPDSRVTGERNGMSRLTEDQVLEIRQCLSKGETQSALGRRFGVSREAVSAIKRRRVWAHLPR